MGSRMGSSVPGVRLRSALRYHCYVFGLGSFIFFFTYEVSLLLFVCCFSDRALKGSHHAWDNKPSLNEGGTYRKEVDPARWCEWCS